MKLQVQEVYPCCHALVLSPLPIAILFVPNTSIIYQRQPDMPSSAVCCARILCPLCLSKTVFCSSTSLHVPIIQGKYGLVRTNNCTLGAMRSIHYIQKEVATPPARWHSVCRTSWILLCLPHSRNICPCQWALVDEQRCLGYRQSTALLSAAGKEHKSLYNIGNMYCGLMYPS